VRDNKRRELFVIKFISGLVTGILLTLTYVTLYSKSTNEVNNVYIENKEHEFEIKSSNNNVSVGSVMTISSSIESSSPAIKSDNTQELITNVLAVQAELNDIEKLVNGSSSLAISESIQKSFDKEDIDYEWARNYENNITDFFRANDQLVNYLPELIECRSERCKVVVSLANKDDMDRVAELIVKKLENNKFNINSKALVERNINKGTLEIFMAKNNEVKLYQ
jgi:hypothetical protein